MKHQRAALIRQAIRQQLTPQPETTCDAYHSRYTGTAKCPCQALRKITYLDLSNNTVSGNYCVKHALELSAKGERGLLTILSDEAAGIPFEGEPLHNKEITSRDYYGI
jgi:ribosomal protein S12